MHIQITVSVIVNEIQTGFRHTPCALDVYRKSRVLLFEFQQYTKVQFLTSKFGNPLTILRLMVYDMVESYFPFFGC